MKGNSSCHIPNDAYREGWERIFGKQEMPKEFMDWFAPNYKKKTTSIKAAVEVAKGRTTGKNE